MDQIWKNLTGSAKSLAVANYGNLHEGPVLIIAENVPKARRWLAEIPFFNRELPLLYLPDWEILPYDLFSPSGEVVSERLRTLTRLPHLERGIVVTVLEATARRLTPPPLLQGLAISLGIGETLNRELFRKQLLEAGYRQVEEVLAPAEFAFRGAVFDLFPVGSPHPVRIEIFDDRIETLRPFDPETQRTLTKIERFELLPAREFPTDREARRRFLQNFAERFPHAIGRKLEQDLRKGSIPSGIEAYLPLWLEETATLFDYLPRTTQLILDLSPGAIDRLFAEVEERYRRRRNDRERPPLRPEELFLPPSEWSGRLEGFAKIYLEAGPAGLPEVDFATQPLPEDRSALSSRPPLRPILFVAETAGEKRRLKERLRTEVTEVAGWRDFLAKGPAQALAEAPLSEGFLSPGGPLLGPACLVVPASTLLGERAPFRRRRRTAPDLKRIIADLESLQVGAPVVHRDHGVGRYRGLQTLTLGGVEGEFLVIQYRGGDLLYVPVTDLHLVARYQGSDGEKVPWHRLGGEEWRRAKERAERRARDVAAELLNLYARRMAKGGHAFPIEWEAYRRFAEAFPFEETPDQAAAIQAVLEDLQRERPMDRIVCGDVGFGKTEIALRAAFVAAMAGRQVAVLVPTTLLAQQHHQTFLDRFADWPIRVEMLSRFVPARKQREILADLASGKVDIVIGTHKLLQKGVRFRDLGLLIIDEEHRFGVRQKERLKALRAEVDLLSLTATPIPRTLHMALSGLRDISIIASPPEGRLPIRTVISEWNDTLIQESILRELHRGGQVYFVHNRIETLERVREEIERLVPEVRLRVAHGQMAERQLEKIMLDFYHGRFDLLLCTTIIESGIDVPTANTIIVDRADRLGLAQLHQLRGRVGRSNRQAFAYFLVPPETLMTKEARRRLEAVEKASDLGAGFLLSSYDLEIRGAGELLGEAQSGQFHEVGLDLFVEMVQRAAKALQAGEEPELESLERPVEIHLGMAALLPEDYLPDVPLRLRFYKRIALAEGEETLAAIEEELVDRFGPLPPPAKALFEVARLRLLAEALGISKIELGKREGWIHFQERPRIDLERLLKQLQEHPDRFRMAGPDRLQLRAVPEDPERRPAWLRAFLETLGPASRLG